jgi:hypothetical protein
MPPRLPARARKPRASRLTRPLSAVDSRRRSGAQQIPQFTVPNQNAMPPWLPARARKPRASRLTRQVRELAMGARRGRPRSSSRRRKPEKEKKRRHRAAPPRTRRQCRRGSPRARKPRATRLTRPYRGPIVRPIAHATRQLTASGPAPPIAGCGRYLPQGIKSETSSRKFQSENPERARDVDSQPPDRPHPRPK